MPLISNSGHQKVGSHKRRQSSISSQNNKRFSNIQASGGGDSMTNASVKLKFAGTDDVVILDSSYKVKASPTTINVE